MIGSIESIGSGIFRMEGFAGNNQKAFIEEKLHNQKQDLDAVLNKISVILAEMKENNYQPKSKLVEDYDLSLEGYRYILEYKKMIQANKTYLKDLSKELLELNQRNNLKDLDQYFKYQDGNSLIFTLENYDSSLLKELADALLNKLGKGVVFIANVTDGKIVFVCKQNDRFNAGMLVKEAAIITGGNGGGKPDIAQAGGKDVTKVDEALNKVLELING